MNKFKIAALWTFGKFLAIAVFLATSFASRSTRWVTRAIAALRAARSDQKF